MSGARAREPETSTAAPEVRVRTRVEWRRWLAAHHERAGTIWLGYPKKERPDFADLTHDAIVLIDPARDANSRRMATRR